MLLANYFAFAQWSTNTAVNNAICTQINDQSFPQIISDGNGGAIIVWVDSRFQPNYALFAQRISVAGIILWATDGVQVTPSGVPLQPPAIISDGAGGAIITWSDYDDSYAQRLNANGAAQWGVNGVIIYDAIATPYQNKPQIASDGSGGAYITWIDERDADDGIYAQRINAAGVVQWAVNGLQVCASYDDLDLDIQITSDGSGGAIIAWGDQRGAPSVNVYAQKVNAAGTMVWTANGVALTSDAGANDKVLQLINDGAGGAIVCWEDNRSGGDLNIYARRINASGTPAWTANGVAICQANNDQYTPQLASDGSGGAIITWDDRRNGDAEIYAQRINTSGTILWAPPDGVVVSIIHSQETYPKIVADGMGGAYITWTAVSAFPHSWDILAQRISSNGTLAWPPEGKFATNNFPAIQQVSQIINDGNNGVIIVWTDGRNGAADIYAQRLNSNGDPGGTVLPITLLHFQGRKLNTTVQLHWQTTSEQNSDYFSIEKSNDGKQFAAIGKVIAAGNSNNTKNYSFTDATPGNGINYYRLRQVDKDGKFTYSPVIKIVNDVSELVFKISPNPASNFLNITYPGKKEMVTVTIYDAQGKLLQQQKSKNEILIKVEIKQFKPGLYFIELSDGETVQKGKFVKQ